MSRAAHLAGKAITLALFLFSLMAWTVMIGKYLDLNRIRILNRGFQRQLSHQPALFSLDSHWLQAAQGTYASLLRPAIQAYHHPSSQTLKQQVRIGQVENALERSLSNAVMLYESRMASLGSIIAGAPFLGLLGTVWGVTDAFGNIALQDNAQLQTLAPGVSGALLTTVAGLLVAIPSVFGYNFLLTHTRRMTTELENFASALTDRIEREAQQHQAPDLQDKEDS